MEVPHAHLFSGSPKARRGFSVRAMMVLVLIVGGWLGWIVHDAQVQRDAVQAIRNAGGMVSYEWEWKSGRYDWKARPRCPTWLLDMIGVDYVYNVKMAVVSSVVTNVDVVLAQVARLSRLEILQLETSRVTDIGLAKLDTLTELKSRDSSPISTTIHSKELIAKQLGWISGATGRTRPVPIPLCRTHWSGTTSGTQDSVEIREESQNL